MNPTKTPDKKPTARGAVTIYQHKELFATLGKLLKARVKKYPQMRGPRTPSQFFEAMAERIITREGKKFGVKLPADLSDKRP